MYNNKSKSYQNSNQNNRGENYGNSSGNRHLRANAYQTNSNNSNYRRLMNNDANSNPSKKPDDLPGSVPMLQYKAYADSNLSK